MIPLKIRIKAHLPLPTPVAFILDNNHGYISIERESEYLVGKVPSTFALSFMTCNQAE